MKKNKDCLINSKGSSKYLECSVCKVREVKVGIESIRVVCWKCCLKNVDPPVVRSIVKSDRPKGWQLMKEFVDKNGDVYHKGKLVPELCGKVPLTDVEKIKSVHKKNKKNRDEKKEKKLVNIYNKKKKKNKKGKKVDKK